jgi:argininosuccinate lyase
VFATDVALRKVAAGTPWREAYHQVRDNLEALSAEDPDAAVAAKTHAGATAGLDWDLYAVRLAKLDDLVAKRRASFDACRIALLG